jgi:hypoxanthine phosphoribosyltransferase
LFIAILNGAFIFAADLFKHITLEAEICFIKLASYKGVKSTGKVITAIGLDVDLYNRHLVIIEDIVDTGKTLAQFLPQLQHHHPASLKIASLLYKPDAMKHSIKIDYLGFTIPDKFVIGYGLDYDGLGRNIKEIYQQV